MSEGIKKIVLAYSGGLDTSVILRWLIEQHQCEVVAFCADLGQADEIATIEERGLATGASQVIVDDLREEFVRDFVFPMMRANAVYEAGYLLGTSIARPLIAKRQIEIARATGADAVAHGATGKGNDQVRFELTYAALAPHLRVIAPWREWDLTSRTALLQFAERHGIPVPVRAVRTGTCSTSRTRAGSWKIPGPSRRTRCSSSRSRPKRRPTCRSMCRSTSSTAIPWPSTAVRLGPSSCSRP